MGQRREDGLSLKPGVRLGEIIGWRAWNVRQGLLSSMCMSWKWRPGIPAEGDTRFSGEGVHAWKTLKQAEDYAGVSGDRARGALGYPVIVIGQVRLWGDVIEFEHGYRAGRAKVHSIDAVYGSADDDWALKRLRRIYARDIGPRPPLLT